MITQPDSEKPQRDQHEVSKNLEELCLSNQM
jgi:hypothetical protein